MIIHTKNFDYPSPYGYLFNAVFNMDDKGAINATMVYINYYERGLIEFA